MKMSNDVEKYEIEVTKMGQNYSFFSYSVAIEYWTEATVIPRVIQLVAVLYH